jgi:hypothetical protein
LLRQLRDGQFHGATNWDASHAFVFVNPSVGGQRFFCVFAHGFERFHALFRSRFFVIASAWRGTNHHENDHAEKREQKHNP